MKKRISIRLLSAFLAFVMVFLMIPFSTVNVFSEENSEEFVHPYPGGLIEKYRLDIINKTSNEGLVSYVNTQFDKMNVEFGVDTGKSTTQTVLSTTKKFLDITSTGLKLLSFVPEMLI